MEERIMQHLKLENHELNPFLEHLKLLKLPMEHFPNQHKLLVYTPQQEKIAVLRYSIYQEMKNTDFFQSKEFFNHVILGVRAGLAGLLCYDNGTLVDHKVFRAYMVRKKQGKSQINYLKTKGKSRAGSRVRLGETKIFFKEIAERLAHYETHMRVDHVFLACATTLIPYLFKDNVVLQKVKSQQNISKIPFHISQPTHENLLKAQRQLTFNQVLIKKNQFIDSQELKKIISNSDGFSGTDEDW
ncbi:MAG: hypothetical protein ACXIUD_05595 [Mongoliitalea sp.]